MKELNPSIVTVLGNHYATFNAERILGKYPSVDIVVRGEAEETIVKLARCIMNGEGLEEVRGLTFRKNGKITATPRSAPG